MSRYLLPHLIVSCLLVALLAHDSKASPQECREAAENYNTARSDVVDAIRTYAACVSSSDGHDDCSGEFATLQSDHDDFETAVSNYESECN